MEIGSLFAAALAKTNDADVILFDDLAQGTRIEKNFPVWTIARELERQAHYGGTNFRPIFTTATMAYDRIIILSDMQALVGTIRSRPSTTTSSGPGPTPRSTVST